MSSWQDAGVSFAAMRRDKAVSPNQKNRVVESQDGQKQHFGEKEVGQSKMREWKE